MEAASETEGEVRLYRGRLEHWLHFRQAGDFNLSRITAQDGSISESWVGCRCSPPTHSSSIIYFILFFARSSSIMLNQC